MCCVCDTQSDGVCPERHLCKWDGQSLIQLCSTFHLCVTSADPRLLGKTGFTFWCAAPSTFSTAVAALMSLPSLHDWATWLHLHAVGSHERVQCPDFSLFTYTFLDRFCAYHKDLLSFVAIISSLADLSWKERISFWGGPPVTWSTKEELGQFSTFTSCAHLHSHPLNKIVGLGTVCYAFPESIHPGADIVYFEMAEYVFFLICHVQFFVITFH